MDLPHSAISSGQWKCTNDNEPIHCFWCAVDEEDLFHCKLDWPPRCLKPLPLAFDMPVWELPNRKMWVKPTGVPGGIIIVRQCLDETGVKIDDMAFWFGSQENCGIPPMAEVAETAKIDLESADFRRCRHNAWRNL